MFLITDGPPITVDGIQFILPFFPPLRVRPAAYSPSPLLYSLLRLQLRFPEFVSLRDLSGRFPVPDSLVLWNHSFFWGYLDFAVVVASFIVEWDLCHLGSLIRLLSLLKARFPRTVPRQAREYLTIVQRTFECEGLENENKIERKCLPRNEAAGRVRGLIAEKGG
ncbi:hypothetical protein PIB30_065607 [Stylosanthes scabra]|uniref:Uncharacterized protein n=1 Tax=Stylosanthes scabra TaxID=79078 RepID=A0ABU6SNL1_9FABA|nr:hypothetical protein [Stylosanthes scabra]